ncbi:LOW QUALITY PROTEIN: hypothetical protein TorRG33x02_070450 [Trema orientale]|uniref:Uncharacterized protein n=1 Tax=Trema orientale TaxID=63057 RepID=A0A2P5FHM8_TREOI|nr:LOW QUALITY PROTEIN: hypothetical protein TorRG33x02_070450 [Trema orientale]
MVIGLAKVHGLMGRGPWVWDTSVGLLRKSACVPRSMGGERSESVELIVYLGKHRKHWDRRTGHPSLWHYWNLSDLDRSFISTRQNSPRASLSLSLSHIRKQHQIFH